MQKTKSKERKTQVAGYDHHCGVNLDLRAKR